MGNGGLSKVVGTRTVCLETYNGTRLVLEDVRHTLNIRLNIISAGRLDDARYCNTFGGLWKLTKGFLDMA